MFRCPGGTGSKAVLEVFRECGWLNAFDCAWSAANAEAAARGSFPPPDGAVELLLFRRGGASA